MTVTTFNDVKPEELERTTEAGEENPTGFLFAMIVSKTEGCMYMNSLWEVQPRVCPDYAEAAFLRFPDGPRHLILGMPRDMTEDGATWLYAIGKNLDPARRVLWLNDVAIALRHGLPLNIALGLAGSMARVRPLWQRRAE
jgi:hypothetical protein